MLRVNVYYYYYVMVLLIILILPVFNIKKMNNRLQTLDKTRDLDT